LKVKFRFQEYSVSSLKYENKKIIEEKKVWKNYLFFYLFPPRQILILKTWEEWKNLYNNLIPSV